MPNLPPGYTLKDVVSGSPTPSLNLPPGYTQNDVAGFPSAQESGRAALNAVAGSVPVLGQLVQDPTLLQSPQENAGKFIRGAADIGASLIPMGGQALTMGKPLVTKAVVGALTNATAQALRTGSRAVTGEPMTAGGAAKEIALAGVVGGAIEGGAAAVGRAVNLGFRKGVLRDAVESGVDQALSQVGPSSSPQEMAQAASQSFDNMMSDRFNNLRKMGGNLRVGDATQLMKEAAGVRNGIVKDYGVMKSSAPELNDPKFNALLNDIASLGNRKLTLNEAIGIQSTINALAKTSPSAARLTQAGHDLVMNTANAIDPAIGKYATDTYDFYKFGKDAFNASFLKRLMDSDSAARAASVAMSSPEAGSAAARAMAVLGGPEQARFKAGVLQNLVAPNGVVDYKGIADRIAQARPALDNLMTDAASQKALKDLTEIGSVTSQIYANDKSGKGLAGMGLAALMGHKFAIYFGLKNEALSPAIEAAALSKILMNPEASSAYIQGLRKFAAGDIGTGVSMAMRAVDTGMRGWNLKKALASQEQQ